MLKIKDSVDLKELEKFGFEPKYKTEIIYDVDDFGNEIDKKVDVISYYYLGGIYDRETFMGNSFSSTWGVTIYTSHRKVFISSMLVGVEKPVYKYLYEGIIFDLIQAGLVEKVESWKTNNIKNH